MRKLQKCSLLIQSFILLFSLSACQPSPIPADELAEANQLYEQEDYPSAIEIYQTLTIQGVDDGLVYYNLGNAYYKNDQLGQAILNYRRAERRMPRDADVKTNLAVAKGQCQDQLEAEQSLGSFFSAVFAGWLSLSESLIILLIIWTMLCLVLILFLLSKSQSGILRIFLIIISLVFIFALTSTTILSFERLAKPAAIVLASEVEVKSGPAEDYVTEFKLHSGTEVQMIEQQNGWSRIQISGDLQGWLPTETIEIIFMGE
ncbi:MAG: tetratricopeptide repeat protein [Anaerolineaceae bacterium]|nr:tetratricopeptide repeat protein [Anaerolineaceae bacterium]